MNSSLKIDQTNLSPDELLDNFFQYAEDKNLSLYDTQEEAILELLASNNVILKTPTGSGKSLVALAGHYFSIGQGVRSIYTAPIKALVSEKFFSLSKELGSENVGMVTGDASINPDAPIICCTAEILANQVLRSGQATDYDLVIMDEFHYYADPQRGWAWQVPLLEMRNTQFLLMSATLGDTDFFEKELTNLTTKPTTLVTSETRPVPLQFEYKRSTLHSTVTDLLEKQQTPIYLVHFTQREATEAAQNYLSLNPLTKEEKQQIKDILKNTKFDSPMGKDIKRYLSGGVGVHHAGLLPKYRLLVEKLAQTGSLKIICGTDTLGVGVNVPIRSVVFTQLCKYDGVSNRTLSVREFKQIAGRAGRKGFDDSGFVLVQDPPHVIENQTNQQKVESGKKKKSVKKKPPERGYTHWNEDTFKKLVSGKPETIKSNFEITHQMVLSVLGRENSGCEDLKYILNENHEPLKNKRKHKRKAIRIYRSLLDAQLISKNVESSKVEVAIDLDDDFALHQPLSLWALQTIENLDIETPDYALVVLAIVESILESPNVILSAQKEIAKNELMAQMKAEGVEYEQRIEKLNEVKHPMPFKEFLWDSFDIFRDKHPWVGSENVKPKAVVRELYESSVNFNDFIYHLKLKRSEGSVLRYFSDAYKALIQTVPQDSRDEELADMISWLKTMISQVDSSLISEWENLVNPTEESTEQISSPKIDQNLITSNKRVFTVMVRNQMFNWLQLLATKQYSKLPEGFSYPEMMTNFWDEFDQIFIDANARGKEYFIYDHEQGEVEQIIVDNEDACIWRFSAKVKLDASNEQGKAVLELQDIYSI